MNYNINPKNIDLFADIEESELENMLNCLNATVEHYQKGAYILMAGDPTHHVGLILSGRLTIYKDDITGNRTVLALIPQFQLFGETFVCAGVTESPVTVEAGADTVILRISFHKILRTCSSCCTFHNTLIKNMLRIIAGKNMLLSDKIDHVSKKTTRQKLASYLIGQATLHHSASFSIGFDRQGLADYLCVNRSALSRELSKINQSGILSVSKNRFDIHDLNSLEDILLDES